MPESWKSPSGSRWEPSPGSDAGTLAAPAWAVTPKAETSPGTVSGRRRRRSPVLAALVVLLSLGGGAFAYDRSVDGTPAAATTHEPGVRPDGQQRNAGPDHRGPHPAHAYQDGSSGTGADGAR